MIGARWITRAVVSAATALLLLDVTIVYVSLPSIGDELEASFTEIQWVVDAYAVALAATLLGVGAMADRFGRRRAFVAGLTIFTAASAGCGLAGGVAAIGTAPRCGRTSRCGSRWPHCPASPRRLSRSRRARSRRTIRGSS